MHVLPDLAYIDKSFADKPVEVVGVHSAKFDNEKDRCLHKLHPSFLSDR